MKHNHTDITIVLDRSGSMRSVANDTIGGFNQFLSDQKKAAGTADITLHQFDDVFETVYGGKPVAEAPELNSQTFVPRGSTALLDAIGRGIIDTGKRLSGNPDDQRAEKVVFVILTDGQENASREFPSQKINEMISHQRDVYKWEFVFLGANQDAIATAAKMNIPAANAMSYAANAAGTTRSFASVSNNLSQYRSGAAATMSFSVDQRMEQKDAGATH